MTINGGMLRLDGGCSNFERANCEGTRELDLILTIISMLGSKSVDLDGVIALLAEHLNANRLYLTLLNRDSQKISIEGAYGLTSTDCRDWVYRVGEGIIGKVIERGKVIFVHNIAESKEYRNKTKSPLTIDGEDVSFICSPVTYKDEVVGTLSFHKVKSTIDISQVKYITRLLKIVGGLIGRTLRRRQEDAEEMAQLRAENESLKGDFVSGLATNMKGRSHQMSELLSLINSVAKTDATVLIRGESGVGKELVADAIHQNSNRKDKPFIKVNCASLPDALIESELFGHEKGAFTGASQRRIGRFEAANGGTIFLDELGDIPASTQIKLLRVLQERELERLGSTQTIKVDVRVIAATNRNLEQMIREGEFREDLYYRLNVFPLYIPALRERISDVPLLANHFIDKFNARYGKEIKRITSAAIDMLMVYKWPGNIRELENCIERGCILSTDDVLRAHNLPPTLQTADSSQTVTSGRLDTIVGNFEKQIITEVLTTTKGNMAKAAESLGVSERIMGLRVKKYELDITRFKPAR
ncbi:MAG: sigma 54-interacting transcriptional regulator [Rikenellaceae bacterium]